MFQNARTLSEAFVYATEVNLATLSDLLMVKKSSKAQISRQRSICEGMVTVCTTYLVERDKIDWGPPQRRTFPRVSEIMTSLESPMGVIAALEVFMAKFDQHGPAARAQP